MTNGYSWIFCKLVETSHSGNSRRTLYQSQERYINLESSEEVIRTKLLIVVGYIVQILLELKEAVDACPATARLFNYW